MAKKDTNTKLQELNAKYKAAIEATEREIAVLREKQNLLTEEYLKMEASLVFDLVNENKG